MVLFFEKGKPTKKTWFYQLNVGRNLGKTDPLNEKDFADFLKLYKNKEDSSASWSVVIGDIDKKTFDLSLKNPNTLEKQSLRTPKEIVKSLEKLDKESIKILQTF